MNSWTWRIISKTNFWSLFLFYLDARFINEDCQDSFKNQWVLTASVQSLSGPSTVYIFEYQSMGICIFTIEIRHLWGHHKVILQHKGPDAQERQTYSVYFKITDVHWTSRFEMCTFQTLHSSILPKPFILILFYFRAKMFTVC